MSKRDEMIREILSDPEIMEKYNLSQKDVDGLRCAPPFNKKIVEVLATMINEMDNSRSSSQIYKQIKNIHKI